MEIREGPPLPAGNGRGPVGNGAQVLEGEGLRVGRHLPEPAVKPAPAFLALVLGWGSATRAARKVSAPESAVPPTKSPAAKIPRALFKESLSAAPRQFNVSADWRFLPA